MKIVGEASNKLTNKSITKAIFFGNADPENSLLIKYIEKMTAPIDIMKNIIDPRSISNKA